MDIRKEINENAKEADKAILHWLLDRYHLNSQWSFVASCSWARGETYHTSKRIWKPTAEGYALYRESNRQYDVSLLNECADMLENEGHNGNADALRELAGGRKCRKSTSTKRSLGSRSTVQSTL